MQAHLYSAALVLLSSGAVIEQTAAAPMTYHIAYQGRAVPIPGGVVQQLLASRRIREVCKVSGRRQFLPT